MLAKYMSVVATCLSLGNFHAQAAMLSARADDGTFGLYAYGGAIGGFPILYLDGKFMSGADSKIYSGVEPANS
jgi:hypothetical protein